MTDKEIIRDLENGKQLVITINYDKGSDYCWNAKPRGIYVRMTEEIVRRYVDSNGVAHDLSEWSSGNPYKKVLLEELTRGSQKKVNDYHARILPYVDEMVELWNRGEYERAARLTFNA